MQQWMSYALELARQAQGTTRPNPTVGAVIVKDGELLASAVTAKGGRPHAETEAIARAGGNNYCHGSELYVTLEPCAHYGKTMPCTDAIKQAHIKKVIIACIDPDPRVAGAGMKSLQDAGIEVVLGIMEQEARAINQGFIKRIQTGLPYITAKMGASLDGKISLANGQSQWITNADTRNFTHQLRAKHEAIMIGSNTALQDNPLLTCRLPDHPHPDLLRIVLDRRLRMHPELQLAQTASVHPCWVLAHANAIAAQPEKVQALAQLGVEVHSLTEGTMLETMHTLGALGVNSVLVEGGSHLWTALLQADLLDEIYWCVAPMLLGNDAIPAFNNLELTQLTAARRFQLVQIKQYAQDAILHYQR